MRRVTFATALTVALTIGAASTMAPSASKRSCG
jgi:hypothetical protein